MQSQYWLQSAKNELKAKTISNLYTILQRLEKLINDGVVSYDRDTRFVVDETLQRIISNQILNQIDSYHGTRNQPMAREQSLKDTMINTRSWWNRKRADVLGQYLYAVICFSILHHLITTQLCRKLSTAQTLVLFIDIFLSFMNETVHFPNAKPQSLVLQMCFSNNGIFKAMCAEFISLFGDENITWDCYATKSDEKPTQILCQEFYSCLTQLRIKYMNNHDDIEHIMQKWSAYLCKCTPTEYNLTFRNHDAITDTSMSSPSVSIDSMSSTSSSTTTDSEHCAQHTNVDGDELKMEVAKEWLATAKNTLKKNTVRRIHVRLQRLAQLINDGVSSYGTDFIVDETLKQKFCHQLLHYIDQYSGTRKLAKGYAQSVAKVTANTRTWWNRTKSMQLGTHFYAVICFYVLHQFIATQLRRELSPKQRLILFIDIWLSFMKETVKFPKTKPKPLLIQRCFLHDGKFKELCSSFISIFGDENIRWNCYAPTVGNYIENGKKTTKYIKKKDRTTCLYSEFAECLHKLKCKWNNNDDDNIEQAMEEWTNYIHECIPREYQLEFHEINQLERNYSNVSPPVFPAAYNDNPNYRSFQSMNGFACTIKGIYDVHPNKERNACAQNANEFVERKDIIRQQRCEAHIQKMQALLRKDQRDTARCFENFEQTHIMRTEQEFDEETTYNVI